MNLDRLLQPRSVAIIGVSRSPEKVGNVLLRTIIADGFEGELIPVNPHATEILGRHCYRDVRDYPGPIDLAVLVVPRVAVEAAVESVLAKGVGAIVIVAAGFREKDAEGAALEEEIARLCRAREVPMLGPNSVGIINTHHRLNASFATHIPSTGGISVLSQSGALCAALLDLAARRRLGLAKLISSGNQGGLNETELLAALGEDPNTRIIVGYLESIADGAAFIRTAARVGASKPVILMKVGATRTGARAAASHTGSLADGEVAYAAAFKRAGVIRADRFEDLLDFAMAFALQPLPRGRRIGVVTNGGGPGVIAADALDRCCLEASPLSPSTLEVLAEHLPGIATARNPVDVLEDAGHRLVGLAVRAVCADPAIDGVIVLVKPMAVLALEESAELIAGATREGKPILAAFLGGDALRPGRLRLRSLGVPDYPSPERAAAAMKAMCDYSAWLHAPPRVVVRFPVNRRRVERIIARSLRAGRRAIGIASAKDVLSAYDFPVLPGHPAASGEEAVEAADRIGYPVAMKILSPDVVHKSLVGGVRLSLTTPDMVRDAFDLMTLRVGRLAPEARIDGVYVEKMAPRGTEVVIGTTRDPRFGPMLMFGLGGVFVEVLKDVAFHLAPVSAEEAMEMLASTRSYALLAGGSAGSAADLSAIAGCLQRISQLVTDFPQIAELDINPLVVGPVGTEPVVADARIFLSDGTGSVA